MSNSIEIFDHENDNNFEVLSVKNGKTYWLASDLMIWLGYTSWATFRNIQNKAVSVCTTLGISVADNFKEYEHDIDGKPFNDHKLTRFACYLIAMNGDIKKPAVAQAQAYFAAFADVLQEHLANADNVERVAIRSDITGRNSSLSATAKVRNVERYDFFLNKGYLGMYNMGISELRKIKHISSSKSPLDFMNKRELAANLFRLTETEGRIKDDKSIQGQAALEKVAFDVGRQVRDVMDVKPEVLALEPSEDIIEVRKRLKSTSKGMAALDNKKSPEKSKK